MFCRKCGCNYKNYNQCTVMDYDEKEIETNCNTIKNYQYEDNDCNCGYDEDDNVFPEYPMYAQSYVPIQMMNQVFKPEIGLNKGTIFPELVSPYCSNQSMEEIEYIKMTNKIGKGCNA